MTATWTLGVLPDWAENVVALDSGQEATTAAAMSAASASLLDAVVAAGRDGRQEYRLTVADIQMIVIPGLTVDGTVDIEELEQSLHAEPWVGGGDSWW